MIRRLSIITLLLIALLAGTVPVAAQDDDAPTPPLLTMLALVPDSARASEGWATVRYADYQALYITEGVELVRMTGGTEMLLSTTPIGGIMNRIVSGPENMQYAFTTWQEMRDVMGFEWIADVNRGLSYGSPPAVGVILSGTFDADAIGTALSARDFEQTEVSGVPVWHRFEDAQTSMEHVEQADPFGGHLGAAARIAVWPDYLANARYWDMIEQQIATTQGDHPALADHDNYRALAEAVTAPEGLLLQAMFFNMGDVGVLTPDFFAMLDGREMDDPTEEYGPLMPYALAVLADRQEDQDQVHLIGLVYPNAEVAENAAEELADRLRAFAPPSQPDLVLVEEYGAAVTPRVYTSESTGQAVALVEVRYPLPDERIDPDNGMFITSGMVFRQWINALMRREFTVLVVTAE